jgi:hypothetical protein
MANLGAHENNFKSPQADMQARQSLVEAIKTPLGFFSLVVLVMDAALMGLALISPGADRLTLFCIVAGILVFLVMIVATIAAWKPEALWGRRYSTLEESFARGLGEEIYSALEQCPVSIKQGANKEKTFDLLCRTIASSPYARSRATKKFCQVLIKTIMRRVELTEKQKRGKLRRLRLFR